MSTDRDDTWKRDLGDGRFILMEHCESIRMAGGVSDVRHDVLGIGHDAYRDLLRILGGPCEPQIVGWCDLVVDGCPRSGLVVTQRWFIKNERRWGALIPIDGGFRVVEIPAPPATAQRPVPEVCGE